jgi:putative ABC transport system substrate-binding protein
MRRRAFIAGLGCAAAWPLTAHAQQPAMQVIGLLCGTQAEDQLLGALRQGLNDAVAGLEGPKPTRHNLHELWGQQ